MIEIKIDGRNIETRVKPDELLPELTLLLHIAAEIMANAEHIEHSEALTFLSMTAASTTDAFKAHRKTRIANMPDLEKYRGGEAE